MFLVVFVLAGSALAVAQKFASLYRFHNGLVEVLVEVTSRLRGRSAFERVLH
jgi:hypothetical protein